MRTHAGTESRHGRDPGAALSHQDDARSRATSIGWPRTSNRGCRRRPLSAPSADTVGLAILTALNITDEYFRARDERAAETGSLAERAAALERIVDHALQLAE